MSSYAQTATQAAIWVLFFASSVYGHVALKFATEHKELSGASRILEIALSPWTISGIASWCLSGVLWIAILDKSPLSEATSISAFRYALVVFAATTFLNESLSWRQWAGIGCIAIGIGLVKWKVAS